MIVLSLCVILVCHALTRGFPTHVVDLTQTVGSDTLFWPGMPGFNFSILHRGFQDNGIWLEANWFSMSEHGGTHLDAPAHFSHGGMRIHQLPIERLFGRGAVLDISEVARRNPDYQLTRKDIEKWEQQHGVIPDGAILLVNFGWASRWPDPTRVFNTRQLDQPDSFHFPGIHPDTIKWLVKNRNLNAVGIDVPSVDFGQSPDFVSHQTLADHGILIVENVANMDLLPPTGSTVFFAPMKLREGSGSPVRVFATMDNAASDFLGQNAVMHSLLSAILLTNLFF